MSFGRTVDAYVRFVVILTLHKGYKIGDLFDRRLFAVLPLLNCFNDIIDITATSFIGMSHDLSVTLRVSQEGVIS